MRLQILHSRPTTQRKVDKDGVLPGTPTTASRRLRGCGCVHTSALRVGFLSFAPRRLYSPAPRTPLPQAPDTTLSTSHPQLGTIWSVWTIYCGETRTE